MSAGNKREFIDYLQRKEGKTMKCPLLKGRVPLPNGVIADEPQECRREECVCWDSGEGWCDPTGLIRPLIRLVQVLEEIKEKMPHELQFRK